VSTYRPSSGLPFYLKDAYGRAVTPVISPPTPAASTTEDTQQQDPAQQLATETKPGQDPPPMNTTQDEDSKTKPARPTAAVVLDAELKKLEHHLKIVGPTMGKMGCVLVDEGRRRTFLDDEDFEGEVAGSEHEDEG